MFGNIGFLPSIHKIWFILGGILLFYTFPLTRFMLPAFYIPLIFVLSGAILRLVAFQYRKNLSKNIILLGYILHLGSVFVAIGRWYYLWNFSYGVKEEHGILTP
jgi:cytochrome bd-type quinol oxidase subunit 2